MHLFPAGAGQVVSIHAPAWGATSDVPAPNMQALVSIHAPAWGATPRNEAAFPAAPCFNPRTRVGCDLPALAPFSFIVRFQSTHPRGVRHNDGYGNPRCWMFQSTHPRGVRPFSLHVPVVQFPVSIHAPAWGATCWPRRSGYCPASFNPRTRVGCDAGARSHPAARERFNPRTRVGCDTRCRRQPTTTACFNPRTRVGCDLLGEMGEVVDEMFQSTHPRGVRPDTSVRCPSTTLRFQSTHPRGVRLFPCFIQ